MWKFLINPSRRSEKRAAKRLENQWEKQKQGGGTKKFTKK